MNISLAIKLSEKKGSVHLRFSDFSPLKARSDGSTITVAFVEDTKPLEVDYQNLSKISWECSIDIMGCYILGIFKTL